MIAPKPPPLRSSSPPRPSPLNPRPVTSNPRPSMLNHRSSTPNPRPWNGMRFHIPSLPDFASRHTVTLRVLERGGIVVASEAPADVVVLAESPEAASARPTNANHRDALVMWEGAFLRALRLPAGP